MEATGNYPDSFKTKYLVYGALYAAVFSWPWIWMAATGSAGEGALVDLLSLGALPALLISAFIAYKEAKPYPPAYKWALSVALGVAFLIVWMPGAVGIYGHSGDPADLLFFGVLAVGITGALLSRFRPMGMAYTLAAMAIAQVLVIVTGIISGLGAVPILNGLFATVWIVSALLFRRAAQTEVEHTN